MQYNNQYNIKDVCNALSTTRMMVHFSLINYPFTVMNKRAFKCS